MEERDGSGDVCAGVLCDTIFVDKSGRKVAAGVAKPMPLLEVDRRHRSIFDPQSIVDLGAQASGRPIHTARSGKLRSLVAVRDDEELVVAQRSRRDEAVGRFDINTGVQQLFPSVLVLVAFASFGGRLAFGFRD